ncbi:hypothetical protein EVAR_24119_1 [Eumeta japonica]|uniref:Uncharacterized protein n=1 Tax=Eumeta variegata TaxID=151549 RepID=A0A4C1YR54_EUMVA|nr:hypothetical protein EVAR_24119_1 [Eumeta japonica]
MEPHGKHQLLNKKRIIKIEHPVESSERDGARLYRVRRQKRVGASPRTLSRAYVNVYVTRDVAGGVSRVKVADF